MDATTYSPRCPQLYGPSGYSGDEDCLHLNIYTPVVSVLNCIFKPVSLDGIVTSLDLLDHDIYAMNFVIR